MAQNISADGGTDTEPVVEVLEGGINEIIVRTLSHGYRFTKGGSDDDVTHVYCGTVENDREIPIGEVPSNIFDALEDAGHSPDRETTPHPAGRDISLADTDSDDDDGQEPIADGGTDNEQIESTLVFDVEHYDDYEPRERVAEGVHERGGRKVEYQYDLDHEGEEARLRVHTRYFLDGELKNESQQGFGRGESYRVEDGVVATNGQDVETFVRANFEADPEIVLTEEFESMVEVAD